MKTTVFAAVFFLGFVPPVVQELANKVGGTHCEKTHSVSDEGHLTCNWGCGGGVDVTCTTSRIMWVCNVSVNGKQVGSTSGWDMGNPERTPCGFPNY